MAWTVDGVPAARRITLDRLLQMKTEKNITVRCLWLYKGYGLLRERPIATDSRKPIKRTFDVSRTSGAFIRF